MPHFGAHESVAGGLHLSFERILSVGGTALQIFTRNQRQWQAAPLAPQEIDDFTGARRSAGPMEVVSHCSYLINLASQDNALWHKSIAAMKDELSRCQRLKIEKAVLHPGSHGGAGSERGVERFVQGLDRAIEEARSETKILVETMAGQGNGLGGSFEELGAILAATKHPDRLGVCFDTCHVFAAGYDFRTEAAYAATMSGFDEAVGLAQIEFFHVNDSKKELGSRVDRHTHIGEGEIGPEGFRWLINDPRFCSHSMTLETPKQKDLEDDRRNLQTLKRLLSA